MTDPAPPPPGRRWALHGAALGAGLLVAFSLPPWGFWPLAIIGIAVFGLTGADEPRRRTRFARGLLFGLGWLALGMAWMVQLTVPGYLVASLAFAALHGLAAVLGGNGAWAVLRRPLAHTAVEALRFSFPFGGVPLASLGISQVAGPLSDIVRVGGVVLLTWVTFQIGFSVAAVVRWLMLRRGAPHPERSGVRLAGIGLLITLGVFLLAIVAPRGAATGETLDVAAVQGGGRQGTSALEVPSALVTRRHLDATATIEPTTAEGAPLDLVLWPENSVDVILFEGSAIHDAVAAEARRLDTPIALGVTEDTPDGEQFVNTQVVVSPAGEIVSRYEKVRRVPFGEYVPMRGLLEALGAPIDRIGRDAVAGPGPAYVDLPDGTRLATVISWEVFFGGRARDGVQAGGEAIINPTNGASYTGTILQTQQVASSRLRALENGRWLVQAAPTGFTAIVDHEGNVLDRTSVSEQRVMTGTIGLRSGLTWYTRMGDAPVIALLLAAFALTWWLDRRRSDVDDERDRAVVDQIDPHVGAEPTGRHTDVEHS